MKWNFRSGLQIIKWKWIRRENFGWRYILAQDFLLWSEISVQVEQMLDQDYISDQEEKFSDKLLEL